ncbi:Uu.00g004360.m01.CDS01 [Anthostomella pinea]|uniref:Uu.00g004360.m01.CDS01 n=1 Tax=Anthostomella pinea TaxID=933095 RepID=A0AAI8VJY1_9PEZI|nr:Uu.00g004360.m01.CDS01 [Anthostomella pinea]
MSTTENTEPKVEETKPAEGSDSKPLASSSVFSMFGGGAKKEKKDDDEDRGDNSGSAKAQRDAAAAAKGDEEEAPPESEDVHFEPVVKLTEQVETVTHEESEEQVFNMRCKMFKFVQETREWKERGTGPLRLLKHKENGKTRLVMRRDKTLKVCANHYITPDMTIAPMSTSDRAWLWNVAADVSEGEPEAITVSVRLANAENANLLKEAWLKAQKENEDLFSAEGKNEEPKEEEPKAEEEKKEEPAAA